MDANDLIYVVTDAGQGAFSFFQIAHLDDSQYSSLLDGTHHNKGQIIVVPCAEALPNTPAAVRGALLI